MERPPIHSWGISAKLVPLTGGHRNIVMRTVGLTNELVFKSTRRNLKAVKWLLRVHTCARQSGFVVPNMRVSESGCLIENGWICEEFIIGERMVTKDLPNLEPKIASFHALTINLPQRPGFRSSLEMLTHLRGGDINFEGMPSSIVEICRDAWQQLSNSPVSVVHGDINCCNLLRTKEGGIALLDWDECRRDYSIFDNGPLSGASKSIKRALLAWEVACSWWLEPEYAHGLARKLIKGD